MADHVVPHFHNSAGVEVIEIGAKEFKCMGANPPYDHPHVYLDMGAENEVVCPYCSTLFRYRDDLDARQSNPAGCHYDGEAA